MDQFTIGKILFIFNLINYNSIGCNKVIPLCDKNMDVCEINLELREYHTMMKLMDTWPIPQHKPVVIDKDGTAYVRMNSTFRQPLTQEDMRDVPLGDGSYKRVFLYNGQLPGPPIVVYEGQQVVVRLKNSLSEMGTTLHFHGAKQLNTPWMDGVSGVSQCNINPGETFTYRFLAAPVGTHWYHSHYGTQRSQGAAGALIILDKNNDHQRRKLDPLPIFDEDFYMVIQDWWRERNEEIFIQIAYDAVKYPFDYNTDICYNSTKQADGVDSAIIPLQSLLINGKGRYKGRDVRYPDHTYIPYEVYKVRRGTFVRLRVITASMMFPLRVSVDHHVLYVISTDGCDVMTQTMDSVIVFNGERLDFYIEANDPASVGNYWIRVENLQRMHNGKRTETGESNGILRYDGYEVKDPRTSRKKCTAKDACHVLNCPYAVVPEEDHWICHPITKLRSVKNTPTLQADDGEEILEYFLNFHFAFPTSGVTEKPSINGVQHSLAVASPMTFPDLPDSRERCDFVACPLGLCRECEHRLHLPLNKIIQFNLLVTVNNAPGVINGNDHPVHIHGHHMQVLKVAFPSYDPITYYYANTSSDFTCTQPHCNTIVWTNRSWEGGKVPGLVDEGAPVKDSLVVPVGGYVITRFKTDNPGFWYMHCHVEFHNAEGMGLVIQAGEEGDMNDKPATMRTCGDFYMPPDPTISTQAENTTLTPNNTDSQIVCESSLLTQQKYRLSTAVLAVMSVFMSFALIHVICDRKVKSQASGGTYTEIGR